MHFPRRKAHTKAPDLRRQPAGFGTQGLGPPRVAQWLISQAEPAPAAPCRAAALPFKAARCPRASSGRSMSAGALHTAAPARGRLRSRRLRQIHHNRYCLPKSPGQPSTCSSGPRWPQPWTFCPNAHQAPARPPPGHLVPTFIKPPALWSVTSLSVAWAPEAIRPLAQRPRGSCQLDVRLLHPLNGCSSLLRSNRPAADGFDRRNQSRAGQVVGLPDIRKKGLQTRAAP